MWGSKALSFADIINLLFTVLAAWLYSEFGALKTKLKNEKGDSQFFPVPQHIRYSHWLNGAQNRVISIGQWGVFNHEKGAI